MLVRISFFCPDLHHLRITRSRYNDSPDENWIIGFYPSDPSLMIATGGSGHAYKFLPVIGRIVADAIEGTLEPYLVKKFAVDRQSIRSSRPSNPQELDVNDLCSPDDLFLSVKDG